MSFLFWKGKARFEKLNAARMSAAREGSTERNNYFCHRQKCNQIWPVPSAEQKGQSNLAGTFCEAERGKQIRLINESGSYRLFSPEHFDWINR